MRRAARTGWTALAAIASLAAVSPAFALGCAAQPGAIGVERIIKIDASSGPIYGGISRYIHEPTFLKPREVVLTFDDGPSPRITRSILKTLKDFCTSATFFPVGRMAIAYPDVVREIAAAGHTIGAHTWSHPNNLRRYKKSSAIEQVEKGFAAIAKAAGQPIAPFFRFPGLNDDARVLKHMQSRGIATFTVDVVSDDSYTDDPAQLKLQTVTRTIRQNGGILLFHDIKESTAQALPGILAELRKRGFKVVHLKSKHALKPVADFDAEISKRFETATKRKPLPETALRAPVHPVVGAFAIARPPVTELAPAPKLVELASHRTKKKPEALRGHVPAPEHRWGVRVDRSNVTSTDAPR